MILELWQFRIMTSVNESPSICAFTIEEIFEFEFAFSPHSFPKFSIRNESSKGEFFQDIRPQKKEKWIQSKFNCEVLMYIKVTESQKVFSISSHLHKCEFLSEQILGNQCNHKYLSCRKLVSLISLKIGGIWKCFLKFSYVS